MQLIAPPAAVDGSCNVAGQGPLRCPPVRWKGPALALLGAAAVAGIAIGFTLGSGSDQTLTNGSTEAGGGSSGGGSTQAATGTDTNAGTGKGTTLPQPPRPVRLGHRLLVATVDDALKQADPALATRLIKISHDAGFDAVMVSSMWTPGARAPSAQERLALGNVVKGAQAEGMR